MRFLPAIAANLALFMAALGFGSLLRVLFPPTFSRLDRISLTLLGGLGLLGALLFVVGSSWLTRVSIALILIPGMLLGLRYLIKELPGFAASATLTWQSAIPVTVIALVMVVSTIAGLAEPTGDIKNSDAIAYHFLGPRVWLREGAFRPVLDEAYTSFPATVETQFAALMAFGGQRAPEFFSVISLLSILLVAAVLASRMALDPSGVWWVLALLITMPVVYRGAYGGFNDALYSGFVLAAAIVGFDARGIRSYLLFGLFCGFAMATKYTGILATALLLGCLLSIRTFSESDRKLLVRHLFLACLAASVIAAPWYLRNWIVMGCPIYPPPPILSDFFHANYLSAESVRRFHALIRQMGSGMGRDPANLILLPFHLTFHPANFLNGAGGIGIVPLALGPFGLFAFRRDSFAKGLGLFAALQTVVWFVTEQEARFLIHVYIVAAIIGVLGWKYAVRTSPTFAPMLSALVIAVSISYGIYMEASAREVDLQSVASASFEMNRKRREIPFLDSFNYINGEPSVQKVLVLEPFAPAYYLEKPYIKAVGRWGEQILPEADTLPGILSSSVRLGISHILDLRCNGSDFRLPERVRGLELVFQRGDQRLYRVSDFEF